MATPPPPGTEPADEDAAGSSPDGLPAEHAAWLGHALAEIGLVTDAAPVDHRRVTPMSGGVDAFTYLVRCPDRDVVVKLNDEWLDAEAAALRAWREHTPWVPEVLGSGTVRAARPLRFLALSAMVNDHGDVIETAAEHLDRSPAGAREVGRELGVELHRLHQARCGSGFGNFADSPGAHRTYPTWSSYLEDFLREYTGFLGDRGVRAAQLEDVFTVIRDCRYVDDARYLHGDVSIRNIAMRGYDPVRISLFDPNPLCGDPSWDIAPLVNKVEYGERRHRSDGRAARTLLRDRELLAGFRETYPEAIPEPSLRTAQLVQAVLQAEAREASPDEVGVDGLDVEVAHQFIRDLIEEMAA